VGELLKACQQTAFISLLASIEKSKTGSAEEYSDDGYGRDYGYGHRYGHEHELLDVFETTLVYVEVVIWERVVAKMWTSKSLFSVQEDVFQDEYPDEEAFEGFTGNEGATLPLFTAVQ